MRLTQLINKQNKIQYGVPNRNWFRTLTKRVDCTEKQFITDVNSFWNNVIIKIERDSSFTININNKFINEQQTLMMHISKFYSNVSHSDISVIQDELIINCLKQNSSRRQAMRYLDTLYNIYVNPKLKGLNQNKLKDNYNIPETKEMVILNYISSPNSNVIDKFDDPQYTKLAEITSPRYPRRVVYYVENTVTTVVNVLPICYYINPEYMIKAKKMYVSVKERLASFDKYKNIEAIET